MYKNRTVLLVVVGNMNWVQVDLSSEDHVYLGFWHTKALPSDTFVGLEEYLASKDVDKENFGNMICLQFDEISIEKDNKFAKFINNSHSSNIIHLNGANQVVTCCNKNFTLAHIICAIAESVNGDPISTVISFNGLGIAPAANIGDVFVKYGPVLQIQFNSVLSDVKWDVFQNPKSKFWFS